MYVQYVQYKATLPLLTEKLEEFEKKFLNRYVAIIIEEQSFRKT